MKKNRDYELDAARGIALIAMVVYHTLFSLHFFKITDFYQPLAAYPIASTFVLIAGISIILMTGSLEHSAAAKKLFLRSLEILLCAALVTAVTWIFIPNGFVRFGILHLIGIGTILAIPFAAFKLKPYVPIITGVLVIALGCVISVLNITGPDIFMPIGIYSHEIYMIDFEPIVPWFGIMLIGLGIGQIIYKNGKRCRLFEKFGTMPKILTPLCFIGRHTLIIYLVHVPIILLILLILKLTIL